MSNQGATFMQTPKRPNLPPTPSTYYKTSLPPLSAILNTKKDVGASAASTPFGGYARLPSIDTFTTPISTSKVFNYPQQQQHSNLHSRHQLTLSTPSKSLPGAANTSSIYSAGSNPNFSFANSSVDTSEGDITTSIESATQSKTSSPTESKAYAFISHSPATFPNQEPSIDNAPLARRKRRRTSPNELSILNKEFDLGSTPNKSRRIEIAKRVSMTEKAVQIWFQNKRQSLRKHSAPEKEVTELPQVAPSVPTLSASSSSVVPSSSTSNDIEHGVHPPSSAPPILTASTPIKPMLNKAQSFISPSGNVPSPIQKRSLSTNSLPKLPSLSLALNKSMFKIENDASTISKSSTSTSASTPTSSTTSSSFSSLTASSSTTSLTSALSSAAASSSNSDPSQLVLNETRKKQPIFLNSNNSSTMTFKLAPAKSAPRKDLSIMERKILQEINLNSSTNRVKAKLESVKRNGENECIENLLSLRAGNWK